MRLDSRSSPGEVGPAQGAVCEGIDQLVQAILVDLQGVQQLPLGLVLPGRRRQRGRQRRPAELAEDPLGDELLDRVGQAQGLVSQRGSSPIQLDYQNWCSTANAWAQS